MPNLKGSFVFYQVAMYFNYIIIGSCVPCNIKLDIYNMSFNFVDASNRPHHLCLLVYGVAPGFTPKLSSHSNSKENKPFLLPGPALWIISKGVLTAGTYVYNLSTSF